MLTHSERESKRESSLRSFSNNVYLVAMDSVHWGVVGDLEMEKVFWCFFCRSESHGLVTLNATAGG
jgi:hypothetical protein